MPEPLIHLESVQKVFVTDEVETHALDDVDLDIHRGDYISISGPRPGNLWVTGGLSAAAE